MRNVKNCLLKLSDCVWITRSLFMVLSYKQYYWCWFSFLKDLTERFALYRSLRLVFQPVEQIRPLIPKQQFFLLPVTLGLISVELFPIRGRISAPLNILFAGRWKRYMEKTRINIILDKLASDEKNIQQCSGFNFIIKK